MAIWIFFDTWYNGDYRNYYLFLVQAKEDNLIEKASTELRFRCVRSTNNETCIERKRLHVRHIMELS